MKVIATFQVLIESGSNSASPVQDLLGKVKEIEIVAGTNLDRRPNSPWVMQAVTTHIVDEGGNPVSMVRP